MSKIQPLGEPINARVRYVVPDSVDSKYATQMTLQQDGPMYALGFYELMHPVVMGTPEQIAEQAKEIKAEGVKARCVARIIIDPIRLVQLHKLLADNLPNVETEGGQTTITSRHDA